MNINSKGSALFKPIFWHSPTFNDILDSTPSVFAFSIINLHAYLSLSTKVALFAPLEIASKPSDPVPANKSKIFISCKFK